MVSTEKKLHSWRHGYRCKSIVVARKSQNQDLFFGATHYEVMFAGIN